MQWRTYLFLVGITWCSPQFLWTEEQREREIDRGFLVMEYNWSDLTLFLASDGVQLKFVPDCDSKQREGDRALLIGGSRERRERCCFVERESGEYERGSGRRERGRESGSLCVCRPNSPHPPLLILFLRRCIPRSGNRVGRPSPLLLLISWASFTSSLGPNWVHTNNRVIWAFDCYPFIIRSIICSGLDWIWDKWFVFLLQWYRFSV
jgi:hypothetical protein